MKTALTPAPRGTAAELHNGDRLSREEFHRLYEDTPDDFKAELIAGVVYLASPLKRKHATSHPWLSALLFAYQVATPGVELGDNGTVVLGDESEPQPDLFLRILPEYGGLSRNSPDDYVHGPPELAVEIAHSSRAFDLYEKREDYARCGVPEYLVYVVNELKLRWFDLRADRELEPASDGVIRLNQFPGPWIDQTALGLKDYPKLIAALQLGSASPEHTDFVRSLAARKA